MASGDDIPDSSDWLNTPLASITKVEAGLRCQVCKDFYKTPMITSCAHTFCSLCIRRCYSDDQKCPACRAGGQESQLRKNVVLEEVVEAFQHAREPTLQFARNSYPQPRSASPKRKLETVLQDGTYEDRPTKRTRASSRRAETAEQIRGCASPYEDKADGDFLPDVRSTRSSSAKKANETPAATDVEVACPICGNFMKVSAVDRHIENNCHIAAKPSSTLRLGGMRPSRQSSSKSSAPVRLPFLAYTGMKEPVLKKKLQDLGIPSWGNKQDMQNRHKAWLSIWNSNCDAKNPRSKNALLADLDEWERTQGASAPKSTATLILGSAIKDEKFDGAGWQMQHRDGFNDLIQKAKLSRAVATKKSTETSTDLLPSVSSSEPALPKSTTHPQIAPSLDVPPIIDKSSQNLKPAGLPIMPAALKPNITNESFPSSQTHPTSSQFTASPRSRRVFEDVGRSDCGQ